MELISESLISVITPTYNASRFIKETIYSVQHQTHQNWEMIIVDDCSTDDTKDIVKAEIENDDRIKLIELDKNCGPAAARNVAINQAKGDYIAFLDSDDLWNENKLATQLKFMKENKVAFSYTGYRIMKEDGEKTNFLIRVPPKSDYKALLKNTIIGTLTVMLDKRQVGSVQMDLNRNCSEDYGLWLSILGKGIQAYGLNEELAYYRKCEKSLSSNKFKSAIKTWNTYRKIENINIFLALWYFANYSLNAFIKHYKVQ